MRIAVVGAGSWGTALAQTLGRGGAHDVTLWARRPEVAKAITTTRHNPGYLSDVSLDHAVRVTADLGVAVGGARIVLLAVPTPGMRTVASEMAPHLSTDTVVVSAAKGFEDTSDKTMSAVLADVLGETARPRITALSGPNIAVEVARGLPAASVVAGEHEAGALVRDACTGPTFRVYSTEDLVGLEYAGALKNIVAIAAGACDGIGAGDNGKAPSSRAG